MWLYIYNQFDLLEKGKKKKCICFILFGWFVRKAGTKEKTKTKNTANVRKDTPESETVETRRQEGGQLAHTHFHVY